MHRSFRDLLTYDSVFLFVRSRRTGLFSFQRRFVVPVAVSSESSTDDSGGNRGEILIRADV